MWQIIRAYNFYYILDVTHDLDFLLHYLTQLKCRSSVKSPISYPSRNSALLIGVSAHQNPIL